MARGGQLNPIDSHSNPKFKLWLSLLSSKGIKKEGLFLLSGEKLVHEYMRLPSLELVTELVPRGHERLTQNRKNIFELSKDLFSEIDELGTHFNILILKTPEIPPWTPEPSLPPSSIGTIEVFCPLGDPNNVGALIRNAEAFGANTVILTQESANPYLPKAVKASAGSILRMSIKKGPALGQLPPGLIVLDSKGTSLQKYQWPKNSRLLVGEEGVGLSSYSGGVSVSIPTLGVESLNASVAVGIALYDRYSKIRD